MDFDCFIKSLRFGSSTLKMSKKIGSVFFYLSLSEKPYCVHESMNDKWRFFTKEELIDYIKEHQFNLN